MKKFYVVFAVCAEIHMTENHLKVKMVHSCTVWRVLFVPFKCTELLVSMTPLPLSFVSVAQVARYQCPALYKSHAEGMVSQSPYTRLTLLFVVFRMFRFSNIDAAAATATKIFLISHHAAAENACLWSASEGQLYCLRCVER